MKKKVNQAKNAPAQVLASPKEGWIDRQSVVYEQDTADSGVRSPLTLKNGSLRSGPAGTTLAAVAPHPSGKLFTTRDLMGTVLGSLLYLGISKMLIGFKPDQVALIILFHLFYYASFTTRRFIKGFSVFIVYWILYDYMKAFPNYQYNRVSIESLYGFEKNLFGVTVEGKLYTLNEYFLLHRTGALDLAAGIFYLCWVPVPLAFATWLYIKKREQFLHFSLTFLFVNLIGFVIYYLYPAVPPWYIQEHGLRFVAATPGSTAGLQRFDAMVHLNVFGSLYAKNSNVFAAMPSLHATYPLIVLYYGLKNRMGKVNVLFVLVMLGIWFSAVYTSHHYLVDVVAGVVCAVCGIFIYHRFIIRRSWMRALEKRLL